VSYLDLRPGDLAELMGVFEEIFDEVRAAFARRVSALDEEERDEGEDPPTPLELLVDVFDWEGDAAPVGFVEFLDALDRAGWELTRLGPRARLTSQGGSAKTRGPRVKRLRSGG
jgi:hypothetical protein